jgi:hypothetical protein
MADPAHTYVQAHEAAARLHLLGLTAEGLRECAAVGLAGRKAATPFHPPSFPGYHQWAETHRALREKYVPMGWRPDDFGGFSTIVNLEGTIAVTVATGTDRTGRPGYPEPTTKYPRGAMTHAAVETNIQLTIPGFFVGAPDDEEETTRERRETWYLLTHVHHDELRIELSSPRHIGDDGRIDSWSERILIGPDDSQPAIAANLGIDPGPTGHIDVPVEPR